MADEPFAVHVHRQGRRWVVEVDGCGTTYARGRTQIEAMARQLVARSYGIPPDKVTLALTFVRDRISVAAPRGGPYWAKVDPADYNLLSRYTWHLSADATTRYAHSRQKVAGDAINFTMAHLILGPPPSPQMRVNYRNGDGLDCRRENLAWATQSQVLAKRKPRGGKSRYKGVTWDAPVGKWVARFRGKNLGRTTDEEQAARWFDAAAREHWGPDAYQNFPCPVPCDADCTAACHEAHLPAFKRQGCDACLPGDTVRP